MGADCKAPVATCFGRLACALSHRRRASAWLAKRRALPRSSDICAGRTHKLSEMNSCWSQSTLQGAFAFARAVGCLPAKRAHDRVSAPCPGLRAKIAVHVPASAPIARSPRRGIRSPGALVRADDCLYLADLPTFASWPMAANVHKARQARHLYQGRGPSARFPSRLQLAWRYFPTAFFEGARRLAIVVGLRPKPSLRASSRRVTL